MDGNMRNSYTFSTEDDFNTGFFATGIFENMDERNSHWKTFSASPEWKNLSSMPQYQKNVSKSEIILMRSTVYSDL